MHNVMHICMRTCMLLYACVGGEQWRGSRRKTYKETEKRRRARIQTERERAVKRKRESARARARVKVRESARACEFFFRAVTCSVSPRHEPEV